RVAQPVAAAPVGQARGAEADNFRQERRVQGAEAGAGPPQGLAAGEAVVGMVGGTAFLENGAGVNGDEVRGFAQDVGRGADAEDRPSGKFLEDGRDAGAEGGAEA